MRFLIWLWVKGQLTSELTSLICWIRCRERSRFCHLDSHIDLQFFAVKKLQTKLQKYWLLSSDNIYFSKWQNTWWVKQVKKTNTGNPNTLSAITINVVLLTCVTVSFFESFRRDLHFRILFHLPFCKYYAPITPQVSSNVVNH